MANMDNQIADLEFIDAAQSGFFQCFPGGSSAFGSKEFVGCDDGQRRWWTMKSTGKIANPKGQPAAANAPHCSSRRGPCRQTFGSGLESTTKATRHPLNHW